MFMSEGGVVRGDESGGREMGTDAVRLVNGFPIFP
jgi:hypothetical protein